MHSVSLAAFMILSTSSYGQMVVRKFYNKDGGTADSASSYYYKEGKKGRLIDLSHPGWTRIKDSLKSSVDTVISYYSATGKMKAREIYYEGRLNGSYVSYHENGRISQKGIYTDDRRVGYFTMWYPQGVPHQTFQYSGKEEYVWPAWPPMINYWDSLGKQLITNGFGFCHCYGVNSTSNWREEGAINNGLKDSLWTGYLGDTVLFRENYRKGEFLGGVRYTLGMEVPYRKFEEQPELVISNLSGRRRPIVN